MTTHTGPRFIFHIGAGKTGTSSIQFTLRESLDRLAAAGVWYLGLMLEHAPVKHYPWQVFGGPDAFHQLTEEEGARQLKTVLDDTIARARAAKVHTLIWSSESFFDRSSKTVAPLKGLIADGVDVQVMAYVRRHDAWVRSAYSQWALKHKTNVGPLMPFAEWIKRRPPLFAPTLGRFADDFPGRLRVRNFDAADDVVVDFLAQVDLAGMNLRIVTENTTPDDTEMLMRALFNDGIREKALPMLFNRVVGRHTAFDQRPADVLAALVPDEEQLAQVLADASDDRAAVDAVLQAQGQPPIDDSPLAPKPIRVDESRLVFALARLAVLQMRRIDNLENRLKKIEQRDAVEE